MNCGARGRKQFLHVPKVQQSYHNMHVNQCFIAFIRRNPAVWNWFNLLTKEKLWKSNISAENYYLAPLPLLPPPYASPVVAGPGRPRPQHCLAETVVKHFLVFIFLISCSIPTLPAPPLVLVLVLPLLLLALEAAVDVSCLEGCKNKKLGLMFFFKKSYFLHPYQTSLRRTLPSCSFPICWRSTAGTRVVRRIWF